MKLIPQGSTSQSVNIYILDAATGNGLGALAFNTSGLQAYYIRPRGSPVAIPLITLASAQAAWAAGGFKELHAVNLLGWYRLDLPDAALAGGALSVSLLLLGATGMVNAPVEIQLSVDAAVSTETAQGVTGTTLTLQNGTRAVVGMYVWLGDQQSQIAEIDAAVPTAKIATLDPPISSPGGTPGYILLRGSGAPVTAIPSVDVGTIAGEDVDFNMATSRWGPGT